MDEFMSPSLSSLVNRARFSMYIHQHVLQHFPMRDKIYEFRFLVEHKVSEFTGILLRLTGKPKVIYSTNTQQDAFLKGEIRCATHTLSAF
jgi:hypothetical protein